MSTTFAGNGNPPPKKPPVQQPESQPTPAPVDDVQELDAGNGNPPPKEQAN